jgi:hypothetical protein
MAGLNGTSEKAQKYIRLIKNPSPSKINCGWQQGVVLQDCSPEDVVSSGERREKNRGNLASLPSRLPE